VLNIITEALAPVNPSVSVIPSCRAGGVSWGGEEREQTYSNSVVNSLIAENSAEVVEGRRKARAFSRCELQAGSRRVLTWPDKASGFSVALAATCPAPPDGKHGNGVSLRYGRVSVKFLAGVR